MLTLYNTRQWPELGRTKARKKSLFFCAFRHWLSGPKAFKLNKIAQRQVVKVVHADLK